MSRHENPPVSLLREACRLELRALGYTARHAARKVARKPARVTLAVAAAAVGAVVAASVAGVSASGHTAAQSAADARAELTSRSMIEPAATAFAANHAAAPASAKGNDTTTHKSASASGQGKQAAPPAKPAAAKPAPAKPAPAKPAPAKPAPAKPAPAKPHAAAAAKPAPAKQAPAKPAPAKPSGPATFYDSVTPGAIPAGKWVAAYSNGTYQASLASLAGRNTVLWIDVHGTNPSANALDVEPGDATPAGAAAWVQAKLTMNPKSTAIIYTFKGDWAEVQADINALPSWMPSHVRYWIADPTGYPHILPGSDATQWYWGPSYDISQADQNFYS